MNVSVKSPVFSVIIPTLQRSADLDPLVTQCASHPLVIEVLVINNASAPLSWDSPKVRVLQQAENIYVNPAWNLGVVEAKGELLAILNDDLSFDLKVFEYCAEVLERGRFSILGPSPKAMNMSPRGKLRHRLTSLHTEPFGTAMFMKRENYVPIPEDMKIWGGDDWLMLNQRKPVAELLGAAFRTEMSTTSGSPEFQRMRADANRVSERYLLPLRGSQPWHFPARLMTRLRVLREKNFGR
ncbi:glycosyltransferase family 2 protein [Neomicrococcus lactis]|uniref:Glycosyltransferase involved in cell wall biosynthesis n=1 Tax=Neomicrococcus lactis TaxID=732241 RepID=A0A7W9DBJ3_9MICC|nr:glycosyltransferase [Neomicrococcus lactis]MBB5598176.1 glycosyltransferase involved in cell wall biosynthesis [Neomicrococcus lactis]